MATSYVSITEFGAVGDGKTDNRAAIQKAIDYAKANGKDVYVPEGNFNHNGLLTLNGVDMYGAGEKSVLKAVGSSQQSVQLKGSGASLKSVTLDSDATSRGTQNTNAKINVDHATDFTVDHVTILNSHSAGMMIYGSSNGTVTNNSLTSTNADSIHMTGGSHHILVQGNKIKDAHDDGIAVVTYGTANVANNITIKDNVVLSNDWGRGVTVVGGYDVKITGNYIDGNDAGLAGIYLATEPAYNTAGVKNVLVDGNTVMNAGSTKTGHGNIMLYDGTSQTISNVTITNNELFGMGIRSNGSGIQTTQSNNTVNVGTPDAMPAAGSGVAGSPTPTPTPTPVPVDEISAGTPGNDQLSGDTGNNRIASGAGDDNLSGGAGDDQLFGNQGNDILYGQDGNDEMMGGQGGDVLYGEAGDDRVLGDLGDDMAFGGQGADQLFGNRGADILYGDAGADAIHGGQGADALFGWADNDTLSGDLGDDQLTGGTGADSFLFRAGGGADIIADFNAADGDRIVLADAYTLASSASGHAMLEIAGGGSVTLTGVALAEFEAGWVTAA